MMIDEENKRHYKKMKNGEGKLMEEALKTMIGKECVFNLFGVMSISASLIGVVKRVIDGAVIVETKKGEEILNLDFVINVQPYPSKKKKV